MLRFHPQFSDDWTLVTFEGPDAEDALNILATRLVRRGDEVEVWLDDDWSPVEEA